MPTPPTNPPTHVPPLTRQQRFRNNHPGYYRLWWKNNGHRHREDHRRRSEERRKKDPIAFNAKRRATYDPKKAKEKGDKYRDQHKEELKQRRRDKWMKIKSDPLLHAAYKERIKPWARKYVTRRRGEHAFAIKGRLSARVRMALTRSGIRKQCKTLELIGCDIPFLRNHLESKFKPGMTLENCGRNGWHIDHIRPCDSFDLTDIEQQKRCFHWTNLQPLWEPENIRKGNKILDYA